MLFFVLSAFLLAAPWVAGHERRTCGRFAVAPPAAIAPGYWSRSRLARARCTAPATAATIALRDRARCSSLFVPNVDPETRNMLDPPMWSLHVEVDFYLVLPLIGSRSARRPPRACCASRRADRRATWLDRRWRLEAWPPEVTWTLPTYLGAFACGIGAAVRRARDAALARALGARRRRSRCWPTRCGTAGGTGRDGHIVADLPASLGFAAIVSALAVRPGACSAARRSARSARCRSASTSGTCRCSTRCSCTSAPGALPARAAVAAVPFVLARPAGTANENRRSAAGGPADEPPPGSAQAATRC